MESVNLRSGLRSRFLSSLIGLAMVISVIYLAVTLNLFHDLVESLAIERSQYQLELLANHVIELKQAPSNADSNIHASVKRKLLEHFDKNVASVDLWFGDQHVNIVNRTSISFDSSILNAISTKNLSHGLLEVGTNNLFWLFAYYPENDYSVLIVRHYSELDIAESFIVNRLSITAFLIFWLTIWVAMFLSAAVAKRFEQTNEKLQYLATHDVLTGLPNRAYLYEYALSCFGDNHVKQPELLGHENNSTAVFIIDLDKFKDINDTMGHSIGDELLKAISTRLLTLRDKNVKVIRYGGDEFVVVVEYSDNNQIIKLAKEVVILCRQPIAIDHFTFETSVSVGISYYPKDGLVLDELLKKADIAMYRAKKHRLGYQTYQSELFTSSEFTISLRGQLSNALEQHQFVLHYQPKVRLPYGNIAGVEALVRWQHPKEGLLSPGLFIDIIEQSTFVHVFTRYVLSQAIKQCREWLDDNISMRIAVNISPYNIMDSELVFYLTQQLSLYNVPPELIEIELTENASMVSIERTKEVFRQLKMLGVKLSIDDFGTGMSSLAYIKQLDVDYIKIDRSFVTDVVRDKRDEAVIASLFLLCKKLNKLTVAEGVENIDQANKLISLGCDYAQGYFYHRPMPVNELNLLLKQPNKTEIIKLKNE